MSVPLEDLERLGAFLDGTLESDELDRFVERLGDDEELYELMLEARAVREELEAESGGTLHRGPWGARQWGARQWGARQWGARLWGDQLWRRRFAVGLAASAALVALVLAPRVLAPRAPSVDVLTDSLVARADDAVLEELYESPWVSLRGAPVATQLSPTDGFRLGVRDVALRMALENDAIDAARRQARSAAQILDAAPGGDLLASRYEDLADDLEAGTPPSALVAEHEQLIATVETVRATPDDTLLYGRFVRSAWLAVRVGEVAWFDRRTVRATVERLADSAPGGEALQVALEPLLDGRASPEELTAARRQLELILEASGQP